MEKPTKRRNMIKRRETSRFAARDRRNRESGLFDELKAVTPLVSEPTVTHVDRIALLRITCALCRIRAVAPTLIDGCDGEEPERKRVRPIETTPSATIASRREGGFVDEGVTVSHMLSATEEVLAQCMDGFLFICAEDTYIMYISEGISAFLGLTQTDLIGRDLEEFINQEDTNDLKNAFQSCEKDKIQVTTIRFKSVVSPRGRCLNLKSATYKAVTCHIQSLAVRGGAGDDSETNNSAPSTKLFLIHGSPASLQTKSTRSGGVHATDTVSSGTSAQRPPHEFTTRHSCDMKFSYCSDSAARVLGYDMKFLMGTSFYDYIYPEDLFSFTTSLKQLFTKGYANTGYYRLMSQSGELIWLQTEFSLVAHTTRGQRGQYAVGFHSVIGHEPSVPMLPVVPDSKPIKSVVGTTATVPQIKLEPPDTATEQEAAAVVATDEEDGRKSGGRRHSYDEVLQWLFRGHPGSPAPTPGTPPDSPSVVFSTDNSFLSADSGGGYSTDPSRGRPVATYAAARKRNSVAAKKGANVNQQHLGATRAATAAPTLAPREWEHQWQSGQSDYRQQSLSPVRPRHTATDAYTYDWTRVGTGRNGCWTTGGECSVASVTAIDGYGRADGGAAVVLPVATDINGCSNTSPSVVAGCYRPQCDTRDTSQPFYDGGQREQQVFSLDADDTVQLLQQSSARRPYADTCGQQFGPPAQTPGEWWGMSVGGFGPSGTADSGAVSADVSAAGVAMADDERTVATGFKSELTQTTEAPFNVELKQFAPYVADEELNLTSNADFIPLDLDGYLSDDFKSAYEQSDLFQTEEPSAPNQLESMLKNQQQGSYGGPGLWDMHAHLCQTAKQNQPIGIVRPFPPTNYLSRLDHLQANGEQTCQQSDQPALWGCG